MPIKNRIADLVKYRETDPCPPIVGLSEIHVFMEPINPQPQTVAKFVEICQQINEERKDDPTFTHKVKACHLCLNFRKLGDIRVMQSSRYISSDSMDTVITECHQEADRLQQGFDDAYRNGEISEEVSVIREKIEATASNKGVPHTDADAAKYPTKYFEFHIRVERKSDLDKADSSSTTIAPAPQPIDATEIEELKQLSATFTAQFGTPVPLSFNNTNEHQRYLNVRFGQYGAATAKSRVDAVVTAINATPSFRWVKTIAEYVYYDSLRALDQGWIDFDENEAQ